MYYEALKDISQNNKDKLSYICPKSGNIKVNGMLGTNLWVAPINPTLVDPQD
jgi:hypothetical protein